MTAVASSRLDGVFYEVQRDSTGWRCTCPGYTFRRTCRHIREAEKAMTSLPLATIGAQEWPMVMQQAKMLCTTGFLPSAINTPEKAVAIMMKGRELGIPPMYALSNIAIIQGKPAANAELMLALIYRDHGDDAIQFAETSTKVATISYKRRNWKVRSSFSFTIEDARAAGLSGGNWNKYPAAMLRARCVSAVARLAFPDTIGGMYTPEELEAHTPEEFSELPVLLPAPQADVVTGEVIEAQPMNGPKSLTPAQREKSIQVICDLIADAQLFGYVLSDAEAAIDMERMSDADLTTTGKTWRARVDELRMRDAAGVPA